MESPMKRRSMSPIWARATLASCLARKSGLGWAATPGFTRGGRTAIMSGYLRRGLWWRDRPAQQRAAGLLSPKPPRSGEGRAMATGAGPEPGGGSAATSAARPEGTPSASNQQCKSSQPAHKSRKCSMRLLSSCRVSAQFKICRGTAWPPARCQPTGAGLHYRLKRRRPNGLAGRCSRAGHGAGGNDPCYENGLWNLNPEAETRNSELRSFEPLMHANGR